MTAPDPAPDARPPVTDLRRRAIQGVRVTMLAQVLKFLLQVIGLVALARLVAPEDYGVVAMATVAAALLTPLTGEALGLATVQRPTVTSNQIAWMFWTNAGLGLGLAGGLAAVAPALARFYGEPAVAPVTVALAGGVLVHALAIQPMALLRRRMRFEVLAAIDIASLGLGTAVAIAVAATGAGLWALVAAQVVPPAARLAVASAVAGWRPSRPGPDPDVPDMLRFGASATASHLLSVLHDSLLPFVLGRLAGPGPVGLVNRSMALVSLPNTQILTATSAVAQPVLSRLAPDPARLRSATTEVARMVLLATAFLTAVTLACADLLVVVALGDDWREAVPYVRWLAALLLVAPPLGVVVAAVMAAGSAQTLLRSKVAETGVTVLALAATAWHAPLTMVAAYSLTGALVRSAIFLAFARRVVGIGPMAFAAMTAPTLLVGLATTLAVAASRTLLPDMAALAELLVSGAAGLGTYAALGWTVPSVRQDARGAWALVRSARHPDGGSRHG